MQIGSASSVDVSTLLGFTRFLTNTLDNVNAFPDASIVALMNMSYRELQSFLLSELMYDWKENTLEGTGNGLINLVASQNNYSFPSNLITIDRIEVNYTGDANTWTLAEAYKLEEIDEAVSNTDNDAPIIGTENRPVYWVRDGVIYLDPMPNQSVTGGLKVWCTLIVTDLSIGGSGDQLTPVFASPFHHLLAYGPAIKWLKQKEQFNKAQAFEIEYIQLRGELLKHYSTRQSDEMPRIQAKSRNMF